MINRKGQMGTGVMNIYRVLGVSVIAIVILGLGGVFYDYEISVKDSEALIFARQMVDCVVPNGVLDLDSLDKNKEDIFSFCEFDELESERYFVSISVSDNMGEIEKLVGGDESLIWVQKIYTSEFKTDSIKKYEPGYYNGLFSVLLKNGDYRDVKMRVEVIVKDEI